MPERWRQSLRGLDFELVGGKAHLNVTRNEMLGLLDSLEDMLRPTQDATALVYYSGHGVAEDDDNWLVPVDDKYIKYQENVPEHAVAAWKGVVGRLEVRGNGLNIVILDACPRQSAALATQDQGHRYHRLGQGPGTVRIRGSGDHGGRLRCGGG